MGAASGAAAGGDAGDSVIDMAALLSWFWLGIGVNCSAGAEVNREKRSLCRRAPVPALRFLAGRAKGKGRIRRGRTLLIRRLVGPMLGLEAHRSGRAAAFGKVSLQ
jgi:hypothetical protein